ncbi:MAG: sensor histidine kinase [Proteobacteria bacterium]|nr:sensor histidine kinase [Pseudomonadota bacterium]
MRRNPSLSRRLVLLALSWSLATLIITAVGLGLLFQRAAIRRVDDTLNDLLVNLIANSQVADGQVYAPALTDERALRVYSGRYWELARPRPGNRIEPIADQRSHSLFDSVLDAPPDVVAHAQARPGKPVPYQTRGPQGEPLRARAEQVLLPDMSSEGQARPTPVIFLAGEDQTSVNRDITTFIVATSAMFIVLGAGLVAAIVVQVRVGLRPLFDLRNEVAAVRRGKAQRVAETYPSELRPLAQELNALVAHNQQVVERQRTHVGNLAHALKTPISVMVTEASQRPGPLAEVVTRQADAMQKQVDHHLRRARAAARTSGQGERTSVAEVLDELARTLGRIFRDKGVEIDWDVDEELFFLGERQDLLEIAGNAIENACKFGRSRVRVRAAEAGPERFRLLVEDDGPGLPPDRREEVLKRGARLDENAPGSGLGLSIVDELARAYGGALMLGDSDLGGLRLEADLPRAAA